MDFKLKDLSTPLKTLVFFFILALILGYGVALLQAYEHTGFNIQKVILSYRGSNDPDMMAFAKPYREILQNSHVHVLTVPLLYFCLSLIFIGTRQSSKFKSVLIALLFSGFFVEYISHWLLRYVSAGFVYVVFFASGLTSLIYLYMCFTSLRNLLEKSEQRI